MSPVDFKKGPCPLVTCNVHADSKKASWNMSNLRNVMSFIFILMSLGSMLHVDFMKWPCRRLEFKGQDPFLPKRTMVL